jgi:K+-transporting ATPase ATPase A chain
VIQNFSPYTTVQTVDRALAGPRLGTDGQPLKDAQGQPVLDDKQDADPGHGPGGLAAGHQDAGHQRRRLLQRQLGPPYENPTPLSNFLQMLSIFLIPAALCFVFGRMVGDARQGWALLGAMTAMFVVMAVLATVAEQQGNPLLSALGTDPTPARCRAAATWKARRCASASTPPRCSPPSPPRPPAARSTPCTIPSPRWGAVPLVLMQLGEVVFGGVGSGLYGMLVFAILAVFIAGLMIGRTPEYLGKKIETFEMKMVAIAILVTPLLVLGGTALAVLTEAGRAGLANPGAHGFSECSTPSARRPTTTAAPSPACRPTRLLQPEPGRGHGLGRFGVIVPVLAIAGSLAAKKRLAATEGTLPTHGPLFIVLLIGAVLLVGLLNYVPALALGPVAEHLSLWAH